MRLWRIEIFNSAESGSPVRVGYVNAETKEQATNAVSHAMGSWTRAEVTIVTRATSTLPALQVLWVQPDE